MPQPADLENYRFQKVFNGMNGDLDEATRAALITCPTGLQAIDQAVADSPEWKECPRCRIQVCVEEELGPSVINVSGEPSCLPKESLIYPTSAKIPAIDEEDAIAMMEETIGTNLVGS